MAGRTDDNSSLYLAVYNPVVFRSFESFQRHALQSACATSGKQKLIKFDSAYPVADGSTVADFDWLAAHAADSKSRKRLENAILRILNGTYVEFLKHGGCYPSATDLIAWKYASVKNEDVESRLAQSPRAGRAGRAGTNDQDIA
jgi:hypothetical protein